MSFTIGVLCLCVFLSSGFAAGERHVLEFKTHDPNSPLTFPVTSDESTPILTGSNPKMSKLPPKMFPSEASDYNSAGPPILSGTEANITEMKNNSRDVKMNVTLQSPVSEKPNVTVTVNTTASANPVKSSEKQTAEQEDMLHSKYKGGQDVDELLKPVKKATEVDEKKTVVPKKDPKGEVEVSPHFDDKGPKLMNETKTKLGGSMLESTSKMMAVSSSVLANTKTKHHGIIEPAKTVVSVLLSVAVILCLGVIGLLVWKRIAMRRFGRDVLINEDDFEEVSDMHTFDRAQIQIT